MDSVKIPKIIHYCWFGRGEKTDKVIKCIKSWKEKLTDYQIIEWNEDNFDVESTRYTKQAYEFKKYAFVSDYVRLYALVNYGGIYLDTDVEVIKCMDNLLENKGFLGFEKENYIGTGIIGAVKGNEILREFLEKYHNRDFILQNGTLDMTTNVVELTKLLDAYDLKKNNRLQNLCHITIYPIDYFCAFDDITGVKSITDNTYCIHYYSKTWLDRKVRWRSKITRIFHRYLGVNCFKWLKREKG